MNAHGIDITDADLPDIFAESAPTDAPHRISAASAALTFILAGNAYFTIRSLKTGTRYTYRVSKADANPRYPGESWFVGLLTGPSNETDYNYIGIIRDGAFRTTAKSTLTAQSTPVLSLSWLLHNLSLDHMPSTVEMWHEGRCGRCGRKLTVPESIEAGIGPECATKI